MRHRVFDSQDRLNLETNGNDNDCLCIRSTVLATTLSFIIALLKIMSLIWYALFNVEFTDFIVVAILAVETIASAAFFVNYKALKNVLIYAIIASVMIFCMLSEIAIYITDIFATKKLYLIKDTDCIMMNNDFASSNSTTPMGEIRSKRVYPPPPIESAFLLFLFASTTFRIWMNERKTAKNVDLYFAKPKPEKPQPRENDKSDVKSATSVKTAESKSLVLKQTPYPPDPAMPTL